MRSNIIIVANRLPLSLQETPDGIICIPSPGGMAAALGPVQVRNRAQWIGWGGLTRPLLPAERTATTLPDYAHLVELDPNAYQRYYHAVANGSLWPILHGMAPRQMYTNTDWSANLAVVKRFAERILSVITPGDVLWLHDFHLLMLPAFLRQAKCTNRIGFFLHIPVADAQLLPSLPHWPDMLRSLQKVDLCGVQTNRDARNLRQSFAEHNLAPPRIMVVPVGIDYDLFERSHTQPEVVAHAKTINRVMRGQTVILSISRLDYTKGILHQLQAVNALLNAHPQSNIRYKLIVSPSREALSEYQDVKRQAEAYIKTIHTRHPYKIDYEYRTLLFDEVTAWYNRADIMLTVPRIDGMNLVAKEYVAARQKPGVLILSDKAGAADQLKDALLVDPTDVKSTFAALQDALKMPAAERRKRFDAMKKVVQREDVHAWADRFIGALIR